MVREDSYNVGTPPDLPIQPFCRIVRPHLRPHRLRRVRECKDFIQRLLEIVGDLGETLIAKLNNLTCLVPRGLGVSLLENGMKHSRKCGPLAFGHLEREILSKMRTTALPANCR